MASAADSSYTLDQRAARWCAKNIKLGIPLVEAALDHLNFLEMINNNLQVFETRMLSRAIKRYETLWLPLLASQGFTVEPMAAPIDIAWIWNVHLLAPQEYTKDCITVTSRVLDHRVMSPKEYAESLEKARERWEDMHAYDHFEMNLDETKTPEEVSPYQTPYVTRIYYDLKSASHRQRTFNYQFSMPHYRSRNFLKSALTRYKMFLHLQHCNPENALVPCFDVALMWQVHMLHPHIYRDDVTMLLGQQLSYDDRAMLREIIADRPDGGFQQTAELWNATFGEEYCVPGTGYRGEIPVAMIPHDISSFKTDTYEFLMERLEVSSTLLTGEFVMSMRIVGGEKVFRRKSSNHVWDSKTGESIVRFLFSESKKPCLQFKLKVIKLFGYNTVGKATIPITSFLDKSANGRRIEHTATLTDSKNRHSEVQLSIAFRINPDIGLGLLKLKTGSFSMNDSMLGLAGSTGVDKRTTYSGGEFSNRVNQDVSNKRLTTQKSVDSIFFDPRSLSIGSTATLHALLNTNHQVVLTTKVILSPSKDFSRIEVLDHDGNLLALSEIIDSRALPTSQQVCDVDPETHCTLQDGDNERAMVIKAPNCDWGICFGKWVRDGSAEDHHGYSRPKLSFYGLSRKMERKRTLIERSDYNFRLSSVMTLDLKKGHIRFKGSDMSEVPQVVALAFSVAMLLTLTSPCSDPEACQERSSSLVHRIARLPMVSEAMVMV